MTKYFYTEIQKLGFEVGPEPELIVCIYRFKPKSGTGNVNEFNLKLVEAIQKDGRIWISPTKINEDVWLRIAILALRSHLEHVKLCLNILEKETRKLLQTF